MNEQKCHLGKNWKGKCYQKPIEENVDKKIFAGPFFSFYSNVLSENEVPFHSREFETIAEID